MLKMISIKEYIYIFFLFGGVYSEEGMIEGIDEVKS